MVLVTGGAGFIGSHLAERLIARGERVVVIDNLATGSIENIRGLLGSPRFEFVRDSVTNLAVMSRLVEAAETIYHLAAAVGVQLVIDSPVHAIETNVRGSEVVLGLAAKFRRRVLIASTSEVYGKRDRVPFREDEDLILGPPDIGRWSYACSKLLDEFRAVALWRERRIPTVVARLFNVVGPRQTGRYGMVVPNLVRQALGGADMTVFGDGSQTRCFMHVYDTVSALIDLAEHPDANGEVFNIGSSEEITVLDLARKIGAITGTRSRIELVPYEVAYKHGFEEMMRRVPDVTKLEHAIGKRRTKSLDTTLRDIVDHHAMAVSLPSSAAN
jgi:UDP-glucose 4-epimerase